MSARTPVEKLAKKRADIRANHLAIKRARLARHASIAIPPAVALIGLIHDPIAAILAGTLGALLTIVTRKWLTEVIGRRDHWLRQDRVTRRNLMSKYAAYKAHVEQMRQAEEAKEARRRKHQQQMQKAAQKRYEARRATECRDKFQHATEESAVRHMETLMAREGKRLSVYQCEFCTHWHVGNSSRGVALVHRPFAKLKEVTS